MSGPVRTISSTDFQRNIGAVMDEVKEGGTVIIAPHGRPSVALLPVREYEALLEARRQLSWARLSRVAEPAPVQ